MTFTTSELKNQITEWIEKRIEEIAAEEIELARERLKARIPEFAAEIGVRLSNALSPLNVDTILQIVLTPRINQSRNTR